MNILYISTSGKLEGGGQHSLFYLLKGLNRKAFRPYLVVPEEGPLAEAVKNLSIDVFVIPFAQLNNYHLLEIWKTVQALLSLAKSVNASMIHADSPREAFYAGLIAKWLSLPMIFHVRVSRGGYFLDRVISFLAKKIIVVAQEGRERFPWIDKSSQKIETVYNGVDTDRFSAFIDSDDIRKELGFGKDTILLGAVGEISPRKGQKELLMAMKNAQKDFPDLRLVIIGRGEEHYVENLRELSKNMGIAGNVRFLDFRRDIERVFAALDLFVLPSKLEGLPRVILEAMASGKAVIASDIPGNREAVIENQTGLLVPPGDADALACAISELVPDGPRRGRMGKQGRRRVEENFRIEENIRKIEQVYRSLAENSSRQRSSIHA